MLKYRTRLNMEFNFIKTAGFFPCLVVNVEHTRLHVFLKPKNKKPELNQEKIFLGLGIKVQKGNGFVGS